MEFNPIILDKNVFMVPRQDLLFCYCGHCHLQLTWKPVGIMVFLSNCCGISYFAKPVSIDGFYFQIVRGAIDMGNVRLLHRKKERPRNGSR